jgi:ABC-type phosphate/phosphonate transport system ATPase subunit
MPEFACFQIHTLQPPLTNILCTSSNETHIIKKHLKVLSDDETSRHLHAIVAVWVLDQCETQ